MVHSIFPALNRLQVLQVLGEEHVYIIFSTKLIDRNASNTFPIRTWMVHLLLDSFHEVFYFLII